MATETNKLDGVVNKNATPNTVIMPPIQTPASNDITMSNVFNSANLTLIIWFLAIYFVVYFIIRMMGYSGESSAMATLTRTIDFVVLVVFALFIIFTFFTQPADQKEYIINALYSELVVYVNNPVSLISIGLFIFILYLAVYLLGIPMGENKPVSIALMENGAWILLVITLFVVFFNKVLHISITDFVKRMWKSFWNIQDEPKQPETTPKETTPQKKEEVFHISNNLYNYEDAQTVCSSYGARLATYDEIENAYNKGGEWCSYGWSSNQMAFFPTQKNTWEKLQKTTNHKNDCGRPGINGGYMANPELRFGVNCYGVKPAPTEKDLTILGSKKERPIPKTTEDVILDKKVEFWKENQDKLLQLSSFNNEKWSAY